MGLLREFGATIFDGAWEWRSCAAVAVSGGDGG